MLNRIVLALFFSTLLMSCFAQSKPASQKRNKAQTLFTVNKKPVSVDEFIYLYKKNHTDKEKDFTSEKINEYLDLFINFKLKVEEAKKRGLDTTKAFLKEYNGYREELRKPYLPDAKIIDSLVKLTYERMKEEISAAHILISVKADGSPEDTLKAYQKIQELRKKIVVTGEDFGRVASQSSEDPSAKINHGNLGYFTAMQMVYPFESAAYTTKVGEVSQPIRTRFGYHILKVLDRRPARGEVEVSHIMLRTGNGKDTVKVKDAIFNIYDQLQGGMKWEDLCTQYSEDASTKENGGKLKPFGTGAMSGAPQFENVAFNLEKPGDISDPFQTQYGWHIIRLERKIPVSSFNEIASTLKNRVSKDERTSLSKQAVQHKLRKEYALVENEKIKSEIILKADSTLKKGNWKPTGHEKETLFTLKAKPYLVKDFYQYLKQNQRSTTLSPQKYAGQLYDQFVDASLMMLAEEGIIKENPEYGFLLREYYEGILLFEIMEKEVWSKASDDSVGQQAYYKSHLADYETSERTKAAFYSSQNPEFREPLEQLIKENAESKIESYVSEQKIKAESGYFKKTDKAVLEKLPWAKGVYPVEDKGIYYLAWLKDILPPGPMSFDEARPAIISDYQTFLEKNWLTRLRGKYAVKVNEKGKQYILQQLQAKG
jgi:peptidyl-prolyl cis-trans isomerase SurA